MRVVLHRQATYEGLDYDPAPDPQDLPDALAEAMLCRGPEWATLPADPDPTPRARPRRPRED
jgi:hypothetical protein